MPRELTLSYGFDTERPYGAAAETPEGHAFRERQLAFIQLMNKKFNGVHIPRTHFILGQYIESARDAVGEQMLRNVYKKNNPLLDLQQHSYSHGVMSELHGVAKKPMSTNEYIGDIAKGSALMKEVLDTEPTGLRTPYGYEQDLTSREDILQGLQGIGIRMVSSDLGSKTTLVGSMTAKRQPHSYAHVGFPEIVEVPAHGIQDVVYLEEKQRHLNIKPLKNVVEHYTEVLSIAREIGAERLSVALCLHPWAVMEYDPKLEKLIEVARRARNMGFMMKTYIEVAGMYRTSTRQV